MGKIARAFSDLTVAALRCDLTRVACIGWTGGSWQFTFPANSEAQVQDGTNSGPFKDEHGIAHDVDQSATAVKQKQLVDRWFAAEFAHLLAEMDALHSTLSGPATKKLMERAFLVFDDAQFERLASISVSHLYNLRDDKQYQIKRRHWTKTRPTSIPIGQRRAPQPNG